MGRSEAEPPTGWTQEIWTTGSPEQPINVTYFWQNREFLICVHSSENEINARRIDGPGDTWHTLQSAEELAEMLQENILPPYLDEVLRARSSTTNLPDLVKAWNKIPKQADSE